MMTRALLPLLFGAASTQATPLGWESLGRPPMQDGLFTRHIDLPVPKTPLIWGDVNFVHTTDVHGWLLGHQQTTWPEPNYSGHIGDIHSFLEHMRRRADEEGKDLLLVDSGDHHDGTGLVSTSTGADLADHYLSQLNYSVLGIGNHELYKGEDAYDVWRRIKGGDGEKEGQGGRWSGRYLTANTNITLPDGSSEPIGERYAKFRTKQGRKVTAFGILYNFQRSADFYNNQSPAELVREAWFLEAIEELPDFFILAGHMPVRGESSEWNAVFDVIRDRHPDVPIFVFGGHSHIRDCLQMDKRSMSLQSGRFLETLGWMSANLTENHEKLQVSRRYLDQNRRTYEYHTGLTGDRFDTSAGLAIIDAVRDEAASLNVSTVLGYAPQSWYLTRSPPGSPDSTLTKLVQDVLPSIVADDEVDASGRPKLYLLNSGSQRGDIYKGAFTRDSEAVASPFTNIFTYCVVPASLAKKLLKRMNDNGASQLMPSKGTKLYDNWMRTQWEQHTLDIQDRSVGQAIFRSPKTLGYVTRDACGGQSDDVEHEPVPHALIPDYVANDVPIETADDSSVTLVLLSFFFTDVVKAAAQLDPSVKLSFEDLKPYGPSGVQIKDVWGLYAQKHWN